MSVHSFRELARTATHRIGESPEFERRWIVTLNDPDTTATLAVQAVGATHGSAHPEVAHAKLNEVAVNEQYEGNRYWMEVVAQYAIPSEEQRDIALQPWLRPAVWKFVTQGVAVPALYYYEGSGSDPGDQKPLTNSAGDYIEGVTADEAQQKITIQVNKQNFPSDIAAAVTNCVNDSPYLGFGVDCVKVQGISGEQVSEDVAGQEIRYWKVTAELLARQTGWNLLLPDVGFNYLVDPDQRRRAYVLSPEGEQIPSSNPVPLDGNGGLKPGGEFPEILNRRVYRRITFSDWFGTPPTN